MKSNIKISLQESSLLGLRCIMGGTCGLSSQMISIEEGEFGCLISSNSSGNLWKNLVWAMKWIFICIMHAAKSYQMSDKWPICYHTKKNTKKQLMTVWALLARVSHLWNGINPGPRKEIKINNKALSKRRAKTVQTYRRTWNLKCSWFRSTLSALYL